MPLGPATGYRVGLASQPEPLPTYSPEEERSLLAAIGQKALTGLGFLGQTIDKTFGGRAIRGLLGGKPRELLSILPFSDTLGITNPEDVIYGRELLQKAGMLDPNTEGFDMGDLAGFAADVFLDPATYLMPFPTTRMGWELSKRGALPRGLGEQIRGAKYVESQVGRLEPVRVGVAGVGDVVPVGTMEAKQVIPAAVQKEVEAAVGEKLVPRFSRVAGRARHEPVPFQPGVGQPNVAIPPAPGMANPISTMDEALESVAAGRLPSPGRYLGEVAADRGSWQALDVLPPPAMGSDALDLTTRAIRDRATKGATPLRGLVGIGIPFMEPWKVFGTGERAARIGDWFSGAGKWIAATAPAIHLRRLFDARAKNLATAEGQNIAATFGRPAEEAARTELQGSVMDVLRELQPLQAKADADELQRLLTMGVETGWTPGTLTAYRKDLKLRDPDALARLTADGTIKAFERQFGRIGSVAGDINELNRGFLTGEHALGIDTPELQDSLNYLMRILQPLPEQGGRVARLGAGARQAMGGSHSSQLARKDLLENFPEGTVQINDLLRQIDPNTGRPLVVGKDRVLSDAGVAALVRQNLTRTLGDPASGLSHSRGLVRQAKAEVQRLGLLKSEAEALKQIQKQGITDPAIQAQMLDAGRKGEQMINEALVRQRAVNKQARGFAAYSKELDPRFATLDANFFVEDPVLSTLVRGDKSVQARASAKAIYEGLPGIAKPIGQIEGAGLEAMSVPRLLREANLTLKGDDGALVAERIAAKALGVEPEVLANYAVPRNVGEDLTRYVRAWTRPEELSPLVAGFDAATNMMKGWLTVPFPAFHVRNIGTGMFNMWRDNAFSLGAMSEAKALMQGRSIEALPGMKATDPAKVLSEIMRELVANRVAFYSGAHQTGDLALSSAGRRVQDLEKMKQAVAPAKAPAEIGEELGKRARPAGQLGNQPTVTLQRFLSDNGLNTPEIVAALKQQTGVSNLAKLQVAKAEVDDILGSTFKRDVKEWGKGWKEDVDLWPHHMAGVSKGGETNTLIKQMREVGTASEDWMRTAHYLAKRRQGFSPAEAAAAVKKYHFDYSDVTQFERSVMKRFIPFYTFSSKNLPPLLEDLVTRPAKLATSIRGATLGSREDGTFVPPYIGEGSNVPLPFAPEGAARYISSFGAPFEDEFFKSLGSAMNFDFKRSMGQFLGGANPFIKFPIEQATGVQLHSGRELRDLKTSGVGDLFSLGDEDRAQFMTQFFANTPFSRFFSTVDRLRDERKGFLPKAINLGTGLRITDVDLAKQQEIAARATVQDLLKDKALFKTFEDIYVKPENLERLAPDELALYGLYKQMQSRAQKQQSKEKRERIGVQK